MSFAPPLLVKVLADQQTHLALLAFNRAARVNDCQPKLRDHAIVFFENPALKDLETLFGIVGPAEVHTGFVVLQIRSAGNDAIDRNVEWRSEKESHRRFDGKRVDISDPRAIAAAHHVARERGVDVAIGEHDCAGFERRNDVALGAIGKVGSVQPRAARGGEQGTLLGAFCRILDERRRVPLREKDRIAFGLQPLIKECELSRLTAAVSAFDDKEFAGILMVSIRDHRRLSLGYSYYRSVKSAANLVPLTTCQIKLERYFVA